MIKEKKKCLKEKRKEQTRRLIWARCVCMFVWRNKINQCRCGEVIHSFLCYRGISRETKWNERNVSLEWKV